MFLIKLNVNLIFFLLNNVDNIELFSNKFFINLIYHNFFISYVMASILKVSFLMFSIISLTLT